MPAGVATGGFGPRVQAIAALCTGAYRLSKRTTLSVLEDLFGLSLSLGNVANLEHATVQAVAAPVAEARAYVQAQPAAYLDETGWREGQQRARLSGVPWRTGSFGTQSPEGSRFVEAIMTMVAALTPQHRQVLEYLTAACEAALRGQAAPFLLPTLDQRKAYMRLAA